MLSIDLLFCQRVMRNDRMFVLLERRLTILYPSPIDGLFPVLS